VYILKCADGAYYTGVTSNPERRLLQHNSGFNKEAYTYTRRPVEIVFCQHFTNFRMAIAWEKRIQKWSRKKKEALINSDWETLKYASICKNKSSHTFFDKRILSK
jgi:putative endonuclease